MVAPARQQAEHPPEVGFVSGFFEDAAADRNGRVARQDHFVRRALDRERLAPREPGDIVARKLSLERRLVDFGSRDARGYKPDPRQQFAPARRGRSERSEEHTSELQSLMRISYAVFCLKKKK